MLDRIIYLLQQAIDEENWTIISDVLQLIQDIEDGYFDNDSQFDD